MIPPNEDGRLKELTLYQILDTPVTVLSILHRAALSYARGILTGQQHVIVVALRQTNGKVIDPGGVAELLDI